MVGKRIPVTIPGKRPKEKQTAAVNTVSRYSGILVNTFIKKFNAILQKAENTKMINIFQTAVLLCEILSCLLLINVILY